MAEIAFSVFCMSAISGESSEITPLTDDKVFSKLVATPPTLAVKITGLLADIFDGLSRVLRQRIHLTIHPVNKLSGVSQRLLEMARGWRPGPDWW